MPLSVPAGYEPLVNPEGEVVFTPLANVKNNVANLGYRPASSEDLQQAELKKQYGEGIGNEIKAGLAGAARGATFGLSDVGLVESGLVNPETLKALKEFNPVASGGGELVGVGASLFALPGGALAGGVSKGSAAAGKLAAGKLAEGAIAKKIIGSTIAGALEGTVYSGGQLISEKALGDPDITAQKVINHLGMGALLGGALSGGFSAAGSGLGKVFRKSDDAAAIVDDVISGDNKINLDLPDEKVLERAKYLNPNNPLKKNDLNWIKEFGEAGPDGKPTIFKKIGTKEVPTLDPLDPEKVYMGDVVKEAMGKVEAANTRLTEARNAILDKSELSMTRDQYQKMIMDNIDSIKSSGKAGDKIGQSAIKEMESVLQASENLPEIMNAKQIRDRLDAIRDSGKLYKNSGGLKTDSVAKAYKDMELGIDDYLKSNIPEYKSLMKEHKELVDKAIDLEDYLAWDRKTNESTLVSDWVTNRVAKPFQSELPGTRKGAELIKWLGDFSGNDFEKAVKANFIFGKINPMAAQAGQLGTWGSRVAGAVDHLRNPSSISGTILKSGAEAVLTGEAPEIIQQIRAKSIQKALMGEATSPGIADRIVKRLSSGARTLLDAGSSAQGMLVPGAETLFGPKINDFLDSHESLDKADQKLEGLMAIEKAKKQTDRDINSTLSSIFSDKPYVPEEPKYAELVKKGREYQAQEFEKLSNQVNQLVGDPEMLLNNLTNGLQRVAQDAPNVATSLNMVAGRALNLLKTKLDGIMPKDQMPLDAKFVPNKTQMASLMRTIQYLNNPSSVLRELQSGVVTKEGKEVLEQVAPELLQEFKFKLMDNISKDHGKGKKIPQSKKLILASFLGQPLDSTMKPSFIQSAQKAFSMPEMNRGMQTSKRSTPKNLTLSSRIQTPLQKISDR